MAANIEQIINAAEPLIEESFMVISDAISVFDGLSHGYSL